MSNNFKMDNELYHYGVLGMKWGVRRGGSRSSGSSRRKKYRLNLSDDARTAEKLKKKKLGEMSNAELRKLNERQNLERNYRQLNKSHIAKGMAFVTSAAATTGTILALYNNSGKLIDIGKKFAKKIVG